MTFVVPFDGSPLAEAALARAAEIGDCCDETVLAATVLPQDRTYATERGWLDQDEAFDDEQIADGLREAVDDVAPDASFRCQQVGRYTSHGEIARNLRDIAEEAGASVVFIGSENVGRIAKPLGSIGSNVAARVDYDIYLVQSG